MSLLLEALKKAEKAKRANTADAPTRAMFAKDSGSSTGLALEIPPSPESPSNTAADLQFNPREAKDQSDALPSLATPEAELPGKDHEQAFPEISLAETEVPQPSPAKPMSADRVDFAALDFSATAAATQPDTPTVEQIAEELAAPVNVLENKIEPVLSLDFPEPAPSPPAQASEPPPPAMPPLVAPREPAQPDVAPVIAQAVAAVEPATAPTRPPTSPDSTADTAKKQETAKKILAAKLDKPKRNFKRLGVILLVSMAVGAAGAYYYWQALDKLTPSPLPAQPAPLAVAPPELQQPDTPPDKADKETPRSESKESAAPPRADEEVSAGTSQKPSQHDSSSVEKPAVPKKAAEKPALSTKPREVPPAEPPPAKKTSSAPNEQDKATVKASSPANPTDSGIKFRRDAGDTRLDPLLASAYQAFMAGDIGKADNDYRKALQQTPNNRDALLGLAAIAANRGQTQEAATHYLRVLQLDPKDAAAQAGLIGLRGYSDPTLSESRLKTLLTQQPEAGYLHFALGNLYAYQARWSEAQEAYFNALHSDAGNADYAFNLAVSLDHLDQRKPALVYYQRALTLVKERSASFDGDQLKKRIHELQAPN